MARTKRHEEDITAVARTKQHEEEEHTGIRPAGRKIREQSKRKKEIEKERKHDKKCRYCRFRANPIELNENKESRNYHSLAGGSGYYSSSSTRPTY